MRPPVGGMGPKPPASGDMPDLPNPSADPARHCALPMSRPCLSLLRVRPLTFPSYLSTAQAPSAVRDDAGIFGQRTRYLPSAGPAFQEGPLRPAQDQGRHRPANSICHPGNLHSHNPMTIPNIVNFKFWILAPAAGGLFASPWRARVPPSASPPPHP